MSASRRLCRTRLIWCLATPWVATGCAQRAPLRDALAEVERAFVCPAPRLTVRERPDLRLHHFACLEQPRWRANVARGVVFYEGTSDFWNVHRAGYAIRCEGPPSQIKDDPGRVRYFEELRDRELRELDGEGVAIFEIAGCSTRRFYVCGFHDRCADLGAADPKEGR